MADAVLPVPCSLKQKARWLRVRKADVVFWWSNGLCCPGQLYCAVIGEGAFILRLLSACASCRPQLTRTPLSPTILLFGMLFVTVSGFFSLSNNALFFIICTEFSCAGERQGCWGEMGSPTPAKARDRGIPFC